MMYSIEIIGAFDFLPKETMIGTLEYERVKGNPSYRFQYDPRFLSSFPNVSLSADLGQFLGLQTSDIGIFRFLGDALPDRWGRALIDKRERMEAQEAGRLPRTFDDFGYLIRIDDSTRMGALRFRYNGQYLGVTSDNRTVPPITSLETFIRETQLIEEAERKGMPVRKQWIDNVILPGSSLGGARPKLSVIDEYGNLSIAKIPSVNDTYDIGLWEHFACTLARKAGINTADTRVLRIGSTPYHTLLSKRFDRVGSRRIHFASSLTLCGLKDGDNAANGKGYPDIIDAMAGDAGINSLERNIRELYRRAAFNILIGNHDDHFRNHGFLLRKDGWELSPAYDLNPSNETTQVLAISPYSNHSSIKALLDASEYYLIRHNDAADIIREVTLAVKGWRQVARNLRIPEQEQVRFANRIEWGMAGQ